jgi:2-amino-4-hydroxy-6-hydroxymethyldihydropteridine diphosphokinase
MTSVTAYIGLGSNLGDRMFHLREAIRLLDTHPGIRVTRLSSVYETAPVGFLDQPDFCNMVAEVRTTLSAYGLLRAMLETERTLHRVRTVRWGPRTIDLDLLLYGEEVIRQNCLEVPHPRMAERAFVLVPLYEIAGDISIPGTDARIVDWLRALPSGQAVLPLAVDTKEWLSRPGVSGNVES